MVATWQSHVMKLEPKRCCSVSHGMAKDTRAILTKETPSCFEEMLNWMGVSGHAFACSTISSGLSLKQNFEFWQNKLIKQQIKPQQPVQHGALEFNKKESHWQLIHNIYKGKNQNTNITYKNITTILFQSKSIVIAITTLVSWQPRTQHLNYIVCFASAKITRVILHSFSNST